MVMCNFGVVVGPDYTIYPARQKSWQEDLLVNGIALAVKTQKQSMANRFGLSWTFQAGSSRYDTILNKPAAWVAFVKFDDLSGNTCFVYPPRQIKDLLFEEPKLDKLKGHKKVVYATSLLGSTGKADR